MYLYRFKLRSVFLIGFGIGFCFALVVLFVQNYVFNNICTTPLSNFHSSSRNILFEWFTADTNKKTTFQIWNDSMNKSGNVTYNKWLEIQKMELHNINMDSYLYGPDGKEKYEANWLTSKVHITCVVFVKKIKLARSIQNTWGKRCNRIYFFGREKDSEVPIINFKVKLISSWQLLCESFNYIWKDTGAFEWVIFVKDDTLVIPENLRYMLAPLNHLQDYYLGHATVMWGQPYNVADAGYVISIGVLRKLIKMFDNSEKCMTGGKYWKQEDYYLAKHLASMGIYPSDTRDQYLRGTFHGYSLQSLLWGVVKAGAYWTHALYPIKDTECCSFSTVTFSIGDHDKMYTVNYLLYHLQVLNSKAVFGNRKAPTSVPDEDVWKVALKEEFNITHLNNISSAIYYELWHAKYPEPEQLINKIYGTKH
ncbi:Glycoprotein-N-acetylgalactosamine 3-beta-galactosyltransferase 1-B [Anthophora plagiata]